MPCKKFRFCGSSGCCGVTVTTSEESINYEYYKENNIEESPVKSCFKSELEFDDLYELDSEVCETDDGSMILPWKENDLCDQHLYSLRERRQSHSMSNVLDLQADVQPIMERRCTFPPSRSKKKKSNILKRAPNTSRKFKRNPLSDSYGDGLETSTETIDNSSSKGLIRKQAEGHQDFTEYTHGKECPLCNASTRKY